MNNGYTMLSGPSLNGLIDVNADSITSSTVSTDKIYIDGVDVGASLSQIPINSSNITALQQITTGQTYTSGTDTTTFDNNVSINNNLLVGGVNISSAITQVPINTSNITALQQITTGQTYTSGTDTTTLDNNVIISGTLSTTGNILEPTITANTLIISPAELACLDSIGSNIQTQLNNKVGLTGTETINGVKTFGSVPLCATNATTSSQLTNKSYVDTAISSISGSVLTTNTVQNITANKTFYGASVLIDDGTGDNTSISQLNQITNFKNNNLVNTTTTTVGLIPAGGLNKIALTDGSNPTSAQILNTTITGTNIPNQNDTYYVSAHSYNFSVLITTQGVPVGQINSINTLAIGTFITSNIGTNFTAGTYITGVAPGIDLYYISQNALNTTLFKVNHTGSLITTNLTLSASVASGTITFKNDGAFQFLTNESGGIQRMPLSINSTSTTINNAAVINGNLTCNLNVTVAGLIQNPVGPFTIRNNATSGTTQILNKDASAVTKTNMALSTTKQIIGGDGTDFNVVLTGDATITTNKTMRILSNSTNMYIDCGTGYLTGTTPLIFRTGAGTERMRMVDTGLDFGNSACNIFGRQDGYDFTILPSGAPSQPIGFTLQYSETAVTFTSGTVFNYTTVLPLLDSGVWLATGTLTLNQGSGSYSGGPYAYIRFVTATGSSFYPSTSNGNRIILPTSTATPAIAPFTSTIIVTSLTQVRTAIQGQIVMSVGSATKALNVAFTKIA